MTIRGLREVEARIAEALNRIEGASNEAVRDVCFDLLGRSVELAPIEDGELRGSGKVEFEEDGNKLVGTVSFNTPYAVVQHEEMSYNHPQGGQAKYLEQPYQQNAERYVRHIADSVRRET